MNERRELLDPTISEAFDEWNDRRLPICGDFFAFIGDFLLQKKKIPPWASFQKLIFSFKISKIFLRFLEIWLQRFLNPPTPIFRVKISSQKFWKFEADFERVFDVVIWQNHCYISPITEPIDI